MKTAGEKFNDIFKAAGVTMGKQVLDKSKNVLNAGKAVGPKVPMAPNSNTTGKVKNNTSNFDNTLKANV